MTSSRPRIAVYYASHDGQTRKIVDRLAEHLGARGVGVTLTDLMHVPTPAADPEANLVLVATAIRYGVHLKPARLFLAGAKASLPASRLGVLSVNLTARKPGRQTADGNVYLRKWLQRLELTPAFAAAVAGRLDYPAYRWLDRQMIRAIMTITGGPTDPKTVVEYTDWAEVEALADQLTALVGGAV